MENLAQYIQKIAAKDFFAVGFRDFKGDLQRYSAADFKSTVKETKTKATFTFRKLGLATVKLAFREKDGMILESFSVTDVSKKLVLEWIEPVHPCFTAKGASIFLPKYEGTIVQDLEKNLVYEEQDWHGYTLYPGYEQMQFLAYFKGGKGVYFAAHDPQHGSKSLEAKYADGKVTLMLRVFCGCRFGEDYVSGYELALKDFTGDWYEPADIYRTWLENSGYPVEKGKVPDFVKESPVVVIYPVRGDGDDKGDMSGNEYFPYCNAMPAVKNLAKKFDSKIMALLMHWEGTAPWAPPYVWPPFGGEAPLAKFRNELHKAGHYLGVYCSGTAWTQTSSILDDYSCEKQFKKEHLETEMIRGPHGEMDAWICNGPKGVSQRIGYDMCNSRKKVVQIVSDEVKKIADFGIDYAQFFDQNLGGESHPCWSRKHAHPPVPGPWQVENMQKLLKKLQKVQGKLVLGAESAAAAPYVRELQFNDLRFNWYFSRNTPVPAYEYVFHEYICNFMGNQCGAHDDMNHKKCPENLLWRMGYAFNCGNLISVILKGKGLIHWGWCEKWAFPEPDQKQVITFVHNLNAVRKAYPQFLLYGRMLKPAAKITGNKWTIYLNNGSSREFDAFFSARWQAPDGSKALIITNFLPREQTVKIGSKKVVLPPLSATVLPEK